MAHPHMRRVAPSCQHPAAALDPGRGGGGIDKSLGRALLQPGTVVAVAQGAMGQWLGREGGAVRGLITASGGCCRRGGAGGRGGQSLGAALADVVATGHSGNDWV